LEPFLEPIPVSKPFECFRMDVKEINVGNRDMLVSHDYLIKWPEVFATTVSNLSGLHFATVVRQADMQKVKFWQCFTFRSGQL